MAIVNRILALVAVCPFVLPGQSRIVCRAGEEVARENVALASLSVEGPCRVVVRGVTFTGNRAAAPQGQALPAHDRKFADHFQGNGLLVVGSAEVVVEDSSFSGIAGFAILASAVKKIRISRCKFRDSGSRNALGRNNTTGGVLLEDGTAGFTVEDSTFVAILGNGVWTHSRYGQLRNGPGVVRRNTFDTIGRDAVQVGHAWGVEVSANVITRVGFPVDAIDVEAGATPVGVDTAGDVDSSHYLRNRMTEMNGKCFDLDGFHHGSVIGNTCVNTADYPWGQFALVMNNTNPDMRPVGIRIESNRFEGMRVGAIFLIGSGHVIRNNVFTRLETLHCSEDTPQPGCPHTVKEPDLLRSGIYFAAHAERAAVTRANRVEGNTIRGWRMDRRCFGFAPGVNPKDNLISGNLCRHDGN